MVVAWLAVAVAFAAAPPAADPGAIAAPYLRSSLLVPLDGAGTSLDLASLSHRIVKFTMTADLTSLDLITAKNRDAVLAGFEADPSWRVVDEDGATIAYQREGSDATGWFSPFGGYHKDAKGAWVVAVRFGARASDLWTRSKLVARATSKAASVQATAYHPPTLPNWQAVAFEWNAAVASVELFDAGTDDGLPHASNALSMLPGTLQLLVADGDTVLAKGVDPGLLGHGALSGAAGVTVTSPAAGMIDVRAHVHTPAPGVTWVRIVNSAGYAWEERAVAAGTREHLGWSADAGQTFYLQGCFPITSGNGFTGNAEIWFAAPGQEPQSLGSYQVSVPKR